MVHYKLMENERMRHERMKREPMVRCRPMELHERMVSYKPKELHERLVSCKPKELHGRLVQHEPMVHCMRKSMGCMKVEHYMQLELPSQLELVRRLFCGLG